MCVFMVLYTLLHVNHCSKEFTLKIWNSMPIYSFTHMLLLTNITACKFCVSVFVPPLSLFMVCLWYVSGIPYHLWGEDQIGQQYTASFLCAHSLLLNGNSFPWRWVLVCCNCMVWVTWDYRQVCLMESYKYLFWYVLTYL